jgi:hypothetical protein
LANKNVSSRIYSVAYEVTIHDKTALHQAFVNEYDATHYIQKEPWIMDRSKKLCCVCNYNTVVFGEGAKTSRELTSVTANDGCARKKNIWWSNTNKCKLCTEGSIFNMFCHMTMKDSAETF